MKRVARIGGAAVLAAALFVAGGIGLFRSRRRWCACARGGIHLGGHLARARDQRVARADHREPPVPAPGAADGLAGVGVPGPRLRPAGTRHGRPQLLPEGSGRAASARSGWSANDNFAAMVGMAALAAARHDFAGALRWGEQAKAINPYNGERLRRDRRRAGGARPLPRRVRARSRRWSTRCRAWRRTPASRTRRELMGDVPGAIKAMEAARDIAGTPADTAWAGYQLGELYFNQGDLDDGASRLRSAASRRDADYVPPFAGLAKVAWARGHISKAIAGYTDVVSRYPSPEYVIALGDLYTAAGQTDQAAQQYALVHVEEQLFRANGVNIDLELALFDAAHGDPAGALTAARDEWAKRHSVHVADAYAWALYANGELRRSGRLRPQGHGARVPQRLVRVPRRDDPGEAWGTERRRDACSPRRSTSTHTSRSSTRPWRSATLAKLGGAA